MEGCVSSLSATLKFLAVKNKIIHSLLLENGSGMSYQFVSSLFNYKRWKWNSKILPI